MATLQYVTEVFWIKYSYFFKILVFIILSPVNFAICYMNAYHTNLIIHL